jgi:hypothetical protein
VQTSTQTTGRWVRPTPWTTQRDVIDCGSGRDTVEIDAGLDSVERCKMKDPLLASTTAEQPSVVTEKGSYARAEPCKRSKRPIHRPKNHTWWPVLLLGIERE